MSTRAKILGSPTKVPAMYGGVRGPAPLARSTFAASRFSGDCSSGRGRLHPDRRQALRFDLLHQALQLQRDGRAELGGEGGGAVLRRRPLGFLTGVGRRASHRRAPPAATRQRNARRNSEADSRFIATRHIPRIGGGDKDGAGRRGNLLSVDGDYGGAEVWIEGGGPGFGVRHPFGACPALQSHGVNPER